MKQRVSYFMHNDIGGYYYGQHHYMKPHRISMAHNLCLAYGLYKKMEVYRPRKVTPEELSQFHTSEYIDFLQRVSPDNKKKFKKEVKLFNVGADPLDCPLFDGLYDFIQTCTASSIDGARKIMSGTADVAINWAGGFHHAKKNQASGFCYVNDIVLAILELLRYYPRVLYVDIDVHHGDGVEEAFYVTDRVMTVSFHKFGDYFFPQTGDVWDKGSGVGEYYAVNCPLKDGIDDKGFKSIFKPVISKVMEVYRPQAVVMQCGADSLAHDPLGPMNLSIRGHAECVRFVQEFGLPLLVLGGGGYNIRSVARCWAYETSVLLDVQIDDRIPYNDYWEYFAPDYHLQIKPERKRSYNSEKYLSCLREKIMENLRHLTAAPSVQMQEVPSLYYPSDDEDEEDTEDALDDL